MRLVACTRKSAYLAMMALLSLIFAGSASARALPLQAAAAKYIGADAYASPTWAQADTSGSGYYLGALQSEKFFYKDGLPNSDADTTSNGVDGCGKKVSGIYEYPTSILCVITYSAVTSTSDTNLQNFLKSTLTDPHQIILAFCNEPENGNNDNGCMCDFGTEGDCGTPANFVSEFETEADEIMAFETANGASNVKVAEDSWASHYESGTGGCNFIVPSQYVNYYLVDIYEGRNGNPISQPEEFDQDPAWNNWISCTSAPSVARGIAEFAINCGEEAQYENAVAQSFTEDDAYLKANFPHLEVWNLWDSGGCVIDPQDEPDAVNAWRSIVAGN